MARRMISIDEKIEKTKELVVRTKSKYDLAVDELEKLMVKKEELKKQEVMKAIVNSDKSFDEIIQFINNDK